jgi:hypothetical protein
MLEIGELLESKEYDCIVEHPENQDIKFYCKYLGLRENLNISEKYQGKTVVKRGKEVKEDSDDNYGFSKERFLLTVQDWEGITKNGQPWPCNDENKETMFANAALEPLVEHILKSVKDAQHSNLGLSLGN